MTARNLFLAFAAAVAILLLSAGGTIYILAGVVVAGGAYPIRSMLIRDGARAALIKTRQQLILPEDAHHNQEADRAFADQRVSRRSMR